MAGCAAPIGVFDSGVGGLSVLWELERLLPGERYIYFADQAHFPYGPRAAADVRELTIVAAGRLIGAGAKLLVVACNTASSAALSGLRARFDVPVVGIEPAVKPARALTRTGRIGVLATDGTVNGTALAELVRRVAGDVQVVTAPAGPLVDLVEHGGAGSHQACAAVAAAVAPLREAGVDVVVLGCTHFAFLRPLVQRLLGPTVNVIEPAPAVARQAARVLAQRGLAAPAGSVGCTRYESSASDAGLVAAAARLRAVLEAGRLECTPRAPAGA